jgi:hypothetical protein
MESSAKTRLPLHSIGIIYPSPSLRTALHFGIIFTLITCTNGEKVKKGSQKTLFLAINTKGGENIAQSKRTTTNLKIFEIMFSIGIFQISIPLRNYISIGIYIDIFKGGFFNWCLKVFDLLSIGRTLLITKRRISFRGSFV